jgi:hypothetical protein
MAATSSVLETPIIESMRETDSRRLIDVGDHSSQTDLSYALQFLRDVTE